MAPISTERLTEAQRVALRMFMERMTAKEIGLRLGITPKAVELRLKSAREVLGVATSAEAARMLAAEESSFRRTLGGPTEVAEPAPDGLSVPDANVDGTIGSLPESHDEGSSRGGAAPARRWVSGINWPLRSHRGTDNDLTLAERLGWPLAIIVGTLIGLGIMINSISTLSQVAYNIFGPR